MAAMERGQFGPSRTGSSRGSAQPNGASPGAKDASVSGSGPEAVTYSWSHANMHYLPNEARREAEAAIQTAKEETKYWQNAAKDWERQIDVAGARGREAEVEAMRKVHEVSWAAVRQSTDYEERIKRLEEMVEEERVQHAEALKSHELLAKQAVDEAQELAKATELRYAKLLAHAEARSKDAEERAEGARKRAEDEVKEAKAREETRVQEIRKWADARVKECDDQKAFETQQMHSKSVQRQRQMEETLYLNGRQKSEALTEAKRHTSAVEQDALEWRAMMEIEFSRKEARIDEWTSKQRKQNEAMENQHKGLLELEKGLHGRTMERTMQRVTRHLEYGDAAANGRDTPTRQAFQNTPLSPGATTGLPSLTNGSPLKLAGGALASGGP